MPEIILSVGEVGDSENVKREKCVEWRLKKKITRKLYPLHICAVDTEESYKADNKNSSLPFSSSFIQFGSVSYSYTRC